MKWAGNSGIVKELKTIRISLAFKTLFEIVFICLTLFNLRSYAQILCLFGYYPYSFLGSALFFGWFSFLGHLNFSGCLHFFVNFIFEVIFKVLNLLSY